jgi:hypothetical protein
MAIDAGAGSQTQCRPVPGAGASPKREMKDEREQRRPDDEREVEARVQGESHGPRAFERGCPASPRAPGWPPFHGPDVE